MSPDIFPKYLKEPSLLYRISYEELKTLVVQYPYCQNLRFLLLAKSKQENHADQERNLNMASTYSLSRTQLYLSMQRIEEQIRVEEKKEPALVLPFLGKKRKEKILAEPAVAKADTTTPAIAVSAVPEIPTNKAAELEDLFEDLEEEEEVVLELPKKTDIEKVTTKSTASFSLPIVPVLASTITFAQSPVSTPQTAITASETVKARFQLPIVPPVVALKDYIKHTSETPEGMPDSAMSQAFISNVNDNDMGRKKSARNNPDNQNTTLSTNENSAKTPRPMPKASFGSWLQQTKSHSPLERQPLVLKHTKKDGGVQAKVSATEKALNKSRFDAFLDEAGDLSTFGIDNKSKKTKEKKKKKKQVAFDENEGSKLIKAIKSRRATENPGRNPLVVRSEKWVAERSERSLKENEDIVSVTLAKILTMQGKNNRALRMYQKLMLKFPEKTPLFVAEIEKLKNKHS